MLTAEIEPAIQGVGETHMSKAEEYESRENKAHLFQDSADPFAIVAGTGHRASVSATAGPAAAAARRRSSAVAPDHAAAAAAATHSHGHHSGYDHEPLAPIESRHDDAVRPSHEAPGYGTTTTTTTTTQTSTHVGSGNTATNGGHTMFYEQATKDLDSVAPHERA